MRLCNRFFAFVLIAVTFIVLEFLKFDETVGAILILNHCSVSFLSNEFNFLVDVENVSQHVFNSGKDLSMRLIVVSERILP